MTRPTIIDEALIDAVHIAALREALTPAKLAELYVMARDSFAESAANLRAGWQHGDPVRIKVAAHRLAGVARNFGCMALGNCAARIEDAAKKGETGIAEQAQFEQLLLASYNAMPG
jgi:HPt (histidine-containing phosphotransfer) domain-containing protein